MREKLISADPWSLFRIIVVPAMFLAVIVKHPAVQWSAAGILILWVILQVSRTAAEKKAVTKHMEPQGTPSKKEENGIRKEEISRTELFLIWQINHRITEQLPTIQS